MNCILDPIFIFGFDMGMSGAAYATIIGQFIGTLLMLSYFPHFQSFRLEARSFLPNMAALRRICSLCVAAGANQLAVTAVQIVMNNMLGHYGELSQYGRDIPLAYVGVITKVNAIFSGVIFGIAQSSQPIIGYNYGAGNTERVKAAFKRAAGIILCISTTAFFVFKYSSVKLSVFSAAATSFTLSLESGISIFSCSASLSLGFKFSALSFSLHWQGRDRHGGFAFEAGHFSPAAGHSVSYDLGH